MAGRKREHGKGKGRKGKAGNKCSGRQGKAKAGSCSSNKAGRQKYKGGKVMKAWEGVNSRQAGKERTQHGRKAGAKGQGGRWGMVVAGRQVG